ncbi:M6 family metalloprotease domain-containing protein [Blastococcus sp. CCUG 61487]|uniref:M6 family metalloprotease domain-containing protein n=1 Tax=Blastococcus sp. CCUG 61487 TaxID=1840703 RepID=UPI0010BFAC34|nr:M6 family metalloprotease domain-containing protein [Blastococcus sp. CCUG 61487]
MSVAVWRDLCAVAPSPELRERLREELRQLRADVDSPILRQLTLPRRPRWPGFDDGTIIPPDRFELGTSSRTIARAAADRAPLRGTVRVIVVLVDFTDRPMTQTAQHFTDLFFSSGILPHGSVAEYFREVSGGLVDLVGEVVGPLRLPRKLSWYANDNFGIGRPAGTPRAHLMAQDTAKAANPAVDFGPYDNDGNGYVDAFVVVHAGRGGEATGDPGDIWSHKWVLPSEFTADAARIFAYLTIPEDARIGVSAHELGHLLFGLPDLYDIDGTSEGVGNWCLMGGGSWNGGGDLPAHPSAWCKLQQGWVSEVDVTGSGTVSFPDVKTSRTVHRLWRDGMRGSEHFLVENRQQSGYDGLLPGGGLLVWHVDDEQPDNSDESHYLVGLVQADGNRDLERSRNRGDSGDCFPGTSANTALTPTTTPGTASYAGQDTAVSITEISAPGETMTATLSVSPAPSPAAVGVGERTLPSPRGNGEVTGVLAKLESDLESLKRLVAPGGAGPA